VQLEARIEALLVDARTHRSGDDLASATLALREAAELCDALDAEHPLRTKTRWRLAKAHHDAGEADRALGALAPLLDDDDPFLGYPQGLDAVHALAVQAWHRIGYDDPRVDRLWERAESGHDAAGDPVRAAQASLQRLWAAACRGESLTEALERFATLDPHPFEAGPSRHPRAPDAGGSVPWLQLDAARTALRAATWSRDAELADLAEDLFEDAATEAELDRAREIWFVEPIALVRCRLGRPDPDDYATTWFELAGRIDHPRRAYHHRVALAEAASDPERRTLRYREAAGVAREGDHGPEWVTDALIQAGDRAGARALVERYGLRVFVATLSETSAT